MKGLFTLQESEALEIYNRGLALQQKGDYIAAEEAYNQLLNSALVKEVKNLQYRSKGKLTVTLNSNNTTQTLSFES